MKTAKGTIQPISVDTPPVTGLPQVMRRHPLFFFFLMAYTFSWIMLIPFVLSEWGILHQDFTISFVLNPFVGPTLAAFIMIRITEGKAGLVRLGRRLVQWRAGLQWYLFVLAGIPALFLLGIFVLPGAPASFQSRPPLFLLVSYVITFVVIFFVGGPLGEEIEWRGFALPRMQARYGPLWGTLFLGALWTGWHFPHFLTSAQRGGPGAGFAPFLINLPIFFLMVMALAIIFTWVFNHTRKSVFIAILLHASINTLGVVVSPLFPAPIATDTDLGMLIGVGAAALLILVLTRGRLGYQPGAIRSTEGVRG